MLTNLKRFVVVGGLAVVGAACAPPTGGSGSGSGRSALSAPGKDGNGGGDGDGVPSDVNPKKSTRANPANRAKQDRLRVLGRELQEAAARVESWHGDPGDGDAEARRITAVDATRAKAEERAALLAEMIVEDPAGAVDEALSEEVLGRIGRHVPAAERYLERRAGTLQGELRIVLPTDRRLSSWTPEVWLEDKSAADPARRSRRLHLAERPRGAPALKSGDLVAIPNALVLADAVAAAGAQVQGNVAALAGTCATTGAQNVAVLYMTFPGVTPRVPASEISNVFFDAMGHSLDGFWRESSYGATSVTGSVFGTYTLSRAYTCNEYYAMQTEAFSLADADVDFTRYSRIFIVFPQPVAGCSYAGLGELGCSSKTSVLHGAFTAATAWLVNDDMTPRDAGVFLSGHEGGHLLGLNHSNSEAYSGVVLGAPGDYGTDTEYGDNFATMGSPWEPDHYAAPHKSQLGWLDPATSLAIVSASGTYHVAPYEALTPGSATALKIKRGPNTNEWLWVEDRSAQGIYDLKINPGAFAGALIHHESSNYADPHSHLLDFVPATATFNDAALTPGSSWFDIYTGLTLAVNASQTAGVDVTVNYGQPTCVFSPPTVQLSAPTGNLVNGGSASFVVTVTNNDSVACPAGVFTVSSTDPNRWTPNPYSQSLTLAPGATGTVSFTSTIAQTTEAGTYPMIATATKRLQSGSASQNVTVTSTCVLAVPTLAISPASQGVAANDTGVFTVTVTNNSTPGCGPDIYGLGTSLPANWYGHFSPSYLTLDSGRSATATFYKSVPADATVGASYAVDAIVAEGVYQLQGNAQVGPSAAVNATVSVLALCVRAPLVVTVTPADSTVQAGTTDTLSVLVTDNDSPTCSAASVTVYSQQPSGWTGVMQPPRLLLGPGATGSATLLETPPVTFAAGVNTVTVVASGPGLRGTTTATINTTLGCVRANPTVALSPQGANNQAGSATALTFTVTNNDSAGCPAGTFALASSEPANWLHAFAPGVLSIAPGASATSTLTETTPILAPAGSSMVTGTATSATGNASASDTITVTPTCVRGNPTVALSPSNVGVLSGAVATFTATITNSDSPACATNVFALSPTQPTGFIPSVVPTVNLAPGAVTTVTLGETTPVRAATGPYAVSLSATSGNFSGGGGATISVTNTCVRANPTVTLAPALASVLSGSSTTLTATIVNHDSAACPDAVFALSAAQPAGWASTLGSTQLTLSPMATGTSPLTETPPYRTPTGNSPVSVTATAATGSGAASATVSVTNSCVRANPTVTIAPSPLSVVAGQVASYTLSVRDNDSPACADAVYALSSTLPNGWSTTITPATLSIAPAATSAATLAKTPPLTTAAATYAVTAAATSGAYSSSASASAVVSLAPLSVGVSLTGTTFARNSTVAMTSLTLLGGGPLAGAQVTMSLRLPNGSTTTRKGTSDGSGKLVWNYKVTTSGAYSVSAVSTYSGRTATSPATPFTVN